jgi:hypothetical protein
MGKYTYSQYTSQGRSFRIILTIFLAIFTFLLLYLGDKAIVEIDKELEEWKAKNELLDKYR